MRKKKDGTGAVSYMLLFIMAVVMVITVLYIAEVARLMTHQHVVDDALADATLASLVVDDSYYTQTLLRNGTPIIRFNNRVNSHRIFLECFEKEMNNSEGFFYNMRVEKFIEYEVEGNTTVITTFTGDGDSYLVEVKPTRLVKTPKGKTVTETSVYVKVKFDIKNMIDGSFITKTKDIYCTLKVEQ